MLREHSSPSIESVPVDQEKEAIRHQESLYAQAGLTPESVTETTLKIGAKLKARVAPDTMPGTESVYLMSSDSLHSLAKAQVKDKKVLTVAGSGDFAQVFASLGAARVDAFDISPFACFMDELKWAAAKSLSFHDYRRFIRARTLMDREGDHSELRDAPVIDPDIYRSLRDALTSQARAYFDQVLGGDYAKDFQPGKNINCHFHQRGSHSEVEGYTKVPHLQDEAAWQAFQERVKDKQTDILCKDINQIPDFSGYDYCYISNIAFNRDRQMELVREMLRKGAKRIGLSMNVSEAGLHYRKKLMDNQGFYLHGEMSKPSPEIRQKRKVEMERQGPTSVYFGKDADWQGNPPPHPTGIKAKIINLDFGEDYGVYLEVTAEDNQEAIKLDNPYDTP